MDLDVIDEDHAAALAAEAASASAANKDDMVAGVGVGVGMGVGDILSTPDRPKRHITISPATTPAPSYFSYQNDFHNDYRHAYHDDDEVAQEPDAPGLRTPSLLSSPSVASSLGFSTGRMSPLRREVSRPPSSYHSHNHSRGPSDASPIARRISRPARRNRDALARRLSQLAHELTTGDQDNVDDAGVDMLTAQLDQIEGAVVKKATPFSSPSTPSPRTTPQRPISFDMQSPGDSIFSSPASSVFRTRFSDLSASIMRDRVPTPEPEPEPPVKKGMSADQAKKVIDEAMKLNEELSQLVANLRARQEESDHIHSLLVERAERAAQRILFLQSRISHLEQELHENDDELQHLRILLKAVEIQMPPHPDKELQRCISSFKQDYQVLKRKRASRSSFATISSVDSAYPGSPYPGSPSR
ncbi:hypothetical protein EDB81DRAFT_253757 [Dactylonectria macrodidyma]|uniref:Uncharacterized protein n=1 Tax=Dactylonectria macrodidyma TaxID=307937 RepID=A0A9P9JMC4_9HYPO|nr:hypothetical protein EDB81DRAFT_253757 [Dactylonectria macrodidyma]